MIRIKVKLNTQCNYTYCLIKIFNNGKPPAILMIGGVFLNIKTFQIVGAVFTIIFGTLLHFTYHAFDSNVWVGVFSAVNESTWEHLKLLVTPMLIFSIVEYIVYGKDIRNFIPVKFISMLIGMIVIIVLFYTYTGILEKNYLMIDITTFFVGVICAYIFSAMTLDKKVFSSPTANTLSIAGVIILACCFVLFTFLPPQNSLFRDSLTGIHGKK